MSIFWSFPMTSTSLVTSLGSTDMKITSLLLTNCCAVPCTLMRGTNATMKIEFVTTKHFDTMTQALCGEISAETSDACVKFPSLPSDFCKFTTCPIELGKTYLATITLPVLKVYPKVCWNSTA